MRKVIRVVGLTLAVLALLVPAAFYGWTRVARYAAFPEAVAVARSAERLHGWYVFAPSEAPSEAPSAGLVFYPGGLVDAEAYAPLMRRLADEGLLTVLVPMPLELAVFGVGRAARVIEAFPQVETWLIAGHSLGGAMAAEFVKGNPEAVAGLVLFASYPAASTDLSTLSIRVVSTYGTENGVTQPEGFEASLERLPPGTELIVIEGGNHAGFGHYGPQSGDGVAGIDREEQQRQTAEAVRALVATLDPLGTR